MISGEIEGNWIAQIHLILVVKFGDDPFRKLKHNGWLNLQHFVRTEVHKGTESFVTKQPKPDGITRSDESYLF